jgi:hypothetical protein
MFLLMQQPRGGYGGRGRGRGGRGGDRGAGGRGGHGAPEWKPRARRDGTPYVNGNGNVASPTPVTPASASTDAQLATSLGSSSGGLSSTTPPLATAPAASVPAPAAGDAAAVKAPIAP